MRATRTRAMICGCRRRLEADDDQELRGQVRAHLSREHHATAKGFDDELVGMIVASHAYDIEYVQPYGTGDDAPDKEFGPEPY